MEYSEKLDFTREQLFAADARARHDPAALTDADIQMLATYSPQAGVELPERREKALAAKNAPPPAPPAAPARAAALDIRQEDDFDELIARNTDRPATYAALGAVFTGLLDSLKFIADRCAALDARIKALEARPVVRYCGIHKSGQSYSEASLCTRSGALWIAEANTGGIPGQPGSNWRLIVKAGGAALGSNLDSPGDGPR